MGKLTALAVKNAKPGRHGDGAGLYLLVKPTGAKSWLLRVQADGKRRDIGIGSLAACNLAEARVKAADLRKHALNGRDPIAERDRDRRPIPTFRAAAKDAHAALKGGWTDKNASAFLTSLETYAYPALGDRRVDTIEAKDVSAVLDPIWTKKPETARKVRVRVGIVLDFSHAKGWRATEAPGRSVTKALAKQGESGNFAAMPYADVPAFLTVLAGKAETVGRNALRFLILTAARSGEVRSARWSHVDLDAGTWSRPAELMKSRAAHIITLNTAAVELLRAIKEARQPRPDALIFASSTSKMLSDMTMTKALRDADQAVTAHGFRSSFRDWAAEQMPAIPDPVAEAALAHAVPDKVAAAYKRTSFIQMRRELLEAWGGFVVPPSLEQSTATD